MIKPRITLHLGVADGPHGDLSTGDLADIIESKYHLMERFYQMNETQIIGYVTDALEGALETALMGGSVNVDPFEAASNKIETRFKEALSNKEFDWKIRGVPTMASVEGGTQRFKKAKERKGKKKRKRPNRPSFIDTGIYQSSFKAWIDK